MAKRNHGPILDRLLSKTNVLGPNECWEYQGGTNNVGYGMIRHLDKMRTTHRVSYEQHNNIEIPKYMCVCHTCDNPLCVNPNHLWLGTRQQNYNDMVSKGRNNNWSRGQAKLGKKAPTTNCIHCKRDIGNHVFKRHHGDNCKLKPKA